MSRNLCTTACALCEGEVKIVGPYRREPRARPETLFGCDAECFDCGAKYFAWCATNMQSGHAHALVDGGFYDLSYRSTFNDEPGEEDFPGSVRVFVERVVVVDGVEIKRVSVREEER